MAAKMGEKEDRLKKAPQEGDFTVRVDWRGIRKGAIYILCNKKKT